MVDRDFLRIEASEIDVLLAPIKSCCAFFLLVTLLVTGA